VRTDAEFIAYMAATFPEAAPATLEYVARTLYPPVFDGSAGYVDQLQRTAAVLGDVVFKCNTRYVARALPTASFVYLFAVPPALHASDLPYTFSSSAAAADPRVASAAVAAALQAYVVSFAQTGTPAAAGSPAFLPYGAGSTLLKLDAAGISAAPDPLAASGRCEWWQQGLYASGAPLIVRRR
jgi:carboxylesterase type B